MVKENRRAHKQYMCFNKDKKERVLCLNKNEQQERER